MKKYENEEGNGGKKFVDSTMIEKKVDRINAEVYYYYILAAKRDYGRIESRL
ncbi:MAG: hypothetical protein PUE34_00800 [Clostridiaceae bacterium]|nr:hypothetical protein [Clostridiaceae bacterium]